MACVKRSRPGKSFKNTIANPACPWFHRGNCSPQLQYQRSIHKAENNAKQIIVFVNLNAELHNAKAVLGSVALLGAGSQSQKLQNCSGHFRMSLSLKDLQCIAVCAEVECSETRSIMPLSHRIGRLQNFFPSNAFMASARSFNMFESMLQLGLKA